jgi:transposase-like protein
MMSPKAVLLDFEETLSAAFINVFPAASVQRDLFHLVQANMKQAGQLGLKAHAKEIVIDVNVLWFAPTKQEFDREVAQFLNKWDKKEPSYSTYFRTNWLNRFLPETWASFGRQRCAFRFVGFAIRYFYIILVLFLTVM